MATRPRSNSPIVSPDGRVKPGIYKIKSILTQTYVDIEVHLRTLCGRPAENLGAGSGLWEIKPLGPGYSVRRFEPGAPDQFCIPMEGVNERPLGVSPYPVAWRVEIVDEPKHRGFGYIRFCWGTTDFSWSISHGSKENGAKVVNWTPESGRNSQTVLMWELIPFEPAEREFPPLYEGEEVGQPPAHAQRVELGKDDFGTIVTEVTTVTTVTTRRRH